MRTIAPLQLMNLTKSFIVFFLITSLAWIAANYVIFRDFYIGWPVLVGNVAITGALGWWWYKRRYHAKLSWDEQGFELQWSRGPKGPENWEHFAQVSLVHEGYGRFLVRLYEDGGKYVDIPASDLKLDPSDFRFEVMDLIKTRLPAEGSRNLRKGS